MIPKYVLSLVHVSTCMIIILLYIKFVGPQLSWCTQLAREVRPTLPTALLPAQSPRVSVFNLPYFVCVCRVFPRKFGKYHQPLGVWYRYKPSDDCSLDGGQGKVMGRVWILRHLKSS